MKDKQGHYYGIVIAITSTMIKNFKTLLVVLATAVLPFILLLSSTFAADSPMLDSETIKLFQPQLNESGMTVHVDSNLSSACLAASNEFRHARAAYQQKLQICFKAELSSESLSRALLLKRVLDEMVRHAGDERDIMEKPKFFTNRSCRNQAVLFTESYASEYNAVYDRELATHSSRQAQCREGKNMDMLFGVQLRAKEAVIAACGSFPASLVVDRDGDPSCAADN